MSVNAAIAMNQRRINLGVKSLLLLLGLGISPLILLWIDRPAWHAKYETPVTRQVIAWIMLCAGWAISGIINAFTGYTVSCILIRNGVQRNGCPKECVNRS